MNRYYMNDEQFNSNKRIFEAYFTEVKTEPSCAQKALESLLYILSGILCALTSENAKRILKVTAIAACLFGFVGIIGAMERGTLSMLGGLSIASLLLGIEYLSLKSLSKKKNRK